MEMEIERYRKLRLAQDEICVAAAFLGISGLWGVSARWIAKGEALSSRVLQIVTALEQKGVLLPEPGGTVWMEPDLYGMIRCMGQAERLGRIGFQTEGRGRWLHLYRYGSEATFLEQDGRGECWLGQLPSKEAMEGLWTGTLEETEKGGGWLGALVFRKEGGCYEPVLDVAWTAEKQEREDEPKGTERELRNGQGDDCPQTLEQIWGRVCHAFWETQAGKEEGL